MEHVGIRGKPYSEIQSYLSNRSVFCEVQGYTSKLTKSNPISVIQGGKMSGQFFGIFTIEMTQIEALLKNPQAFEYITGTQLTNDLSSDIASCGYVDDINHLISNESKDELAKTTQDAHNLTVNLYTENRLLVNDGKTQTLQVEKNTNEAYDMNREVISITDSRGKTVKAKSTMKILGVTMNSRCSMDTQLSKLKSRLGLEYSKIKPYMHFLSLEDRKTIINSKLRSIVDYALPLFMGENQQTVQRLESLYMTINRIIKGGLTFKVNSIKICNKIKVNLPLRHIRKVSAQYIHKHLKTKKCSALIDELIIPKRKISHIYVKQPQMTT